MSAREIPTLRLSEGPPFTIIATSYNRDAPSGLGEFSTEAEATTAMTALQKRLDAQRTTKAPSKKEIRSIVA